MNGAAVPKSTYGLDVFDEIEDDEQRKSVLGMVADALDCMQECEDYIEMKELKNCRPFYDEARDKRFAGPFRKGIGARLFRREDVSFQLKCISRGERTGTHKDCWNCTWNGYRKTLSLCFTWKDANGDYWSLKIVMNSHAKAGDFKTKRLRIKLLLTGVKSGIQNLDRAYELLVLAQGEKGGHQYPSGLTAATFLNLVLEDEASPWSEDDIGNGTMLKRMKFPACFVRTIFLSAPASILFWHHQQVKDPRRAIQLAFYAAYMAGFSRFFYLGLENMQRLHDSPNPSLDMYQMASETFPSAFGDASSGRFNPLLIQFKKVFMKESGQVNDDSMNAMVDGIMGILQWIDEKTGTEEFNHFNIEKRVRECINKWHDDGYKVFDCSEFRLMLVVQMCCLAKVVICGHKDLHNLVYPVSNLGAMKQLGHLDARERELAMARVVTENGLDAFGLDAGEGSACEYANRRLNDIFDYVMHGQLLLRIGEDGDNLVKQFGSARWESF